MLTFIETTSMVGFPIHCAIFLEFQIDSFVFHLTAEAGIPKCNAHVAQTASQTNSNSVSM